MSMNLKQQDRGRNIALKDNCGVFEGDTNRLALTSKQPWYQDAHAALDRPLKPNPFRFLAPIS